MPTTKKRINISVSKELDRALKELAERDEVPQATKAEEMLRLGLEIEEDRYLSEIADTRLKNNPRFVKDSDAIWESATR